METYSTEDLLKQTNANMGPLNVILAVVMALFIFEVSSAQLQQGNYFESGVQVGRGLLAVCDETNATTGQIRFDNNQLEVCGDGGTWIPLETTELASSVSQLEEANVELGKLVNDLIIAKAERIANEALLSATAAVDTANAAEAIASESNERSTNASEVVEELRQDMFGIAPVGTILAWHKSFSGTPNLPEAWMECNGQEVTDGDSPYVGSNLPNLNGENRFLRGSTSSGATQSDSIRTHDHIVKMVGQETLESNVDYGTNYGTCSSEPALLFGSTTRRHSGTCNAYNRLRAMDTGGEETRPTNMAVVWIMRIK